MRREEKQSKLTSYVVRHQKKSLFKTEDSNSRTGKYKNVRSLPKSIDLTAD